MVVFSGGRGRYNEKENEMRRTIMIIFLILTVALVSCKKDAQPGSAMYKYKYEKCEYYKQKYEKYKRKKQKYEKKKDGKLKQKKQKYGKYGEYDTCDVYRPDYDECVGGGCESVTALKIRRDEYINVVIDAEIKLEIKIETLIKSDEKPVQGTSAAVPSAVTDVQAVLAELDKTTIKILGEHLTDENLEKIESDQEKLKQVAVELDKFIASRNAFVEYLKKALAEGGLRAETAGQQSSVVGDIQGSEAKLAALVK
ncbi:hypothetical protein [Borrelia sp. P9F1]|uniref:hypothetical protein n=1 Tax=Borrelia sp. P9F1 TaxID=3058374 RepID=UPI002648F158|nr:hypothetical protein [Borrelia sp. P9F1]WKC58684.1 hypothetical protein QYZ68_05630 [Borrelia sp. P9F1]